MASVEHGPLQKRGVSTTGDTLLSNGDTTGLPQKYNTTSFIKTSVGIYDGHDQLSGYSGIRSDKITGLGATAFPTHAYISLGSIQDSSDKTGSASVPASTSTGTGNSGNTLPIPTGGGGG